MTPKEKRDLAVIDALATAEQRGDDAELIEILREERDRIASRHNLTIGDTIDALAWARKQKGKVR